MAVDLNKRDIYEGNIPCSDIEICLKVLRTMGRLALQIENGSAAYTLMGKTVQIIELMVKAERS